MTPVDPSTVLTTPKSPSKVLKTVYMTPAQSVRLKALAEELDRPLAELVREGLDHVLGIEEEKLPEKPTQLGLFGD